MSQTADTHKVIIWCDKVMFFAFCHFIFFVPISIVAVEYAFGLAFLPYVIKRITLFSLGLKEKASRGERPSAGQNFFDFFKAFKPVDNFLNLPIAVFVLINFLSIFVSHAPWESVKGFFFKLLQSVFFYFTFLECMKNKKQIKIFLMVFLVSSVLIVTNGIVQLLTNEGFIFGHMLKGGRVESSFKHPNDLGAYLLVVSLLMLGFILYNNPFRKNFDHFTGNKKLFQIVVEVFFILLFMLFVACIGFTFSRGAWVAFFASLLLITCRNLKFLPVSILIIVLFAVIFTPKIEKSREVSILSDNILSEQEIKARFGDAVTEEKIQVMKKAIGSGRATFWKESLSIIRKFPLLGTGINTYARVAPKFKISWGGYPHNSYLHMAAEIGIPGLLVFLWIIGQLLNRTLRNIWVIKDGLLLSVVVGAGAGMFGFLVHSFVDTNFYSVQLSNYMWVTLGLIVAAQNIGLKQRNGANA